MYEFNGDDGFIHSTKFIADKRGYRARVSQRLIGTAGVDESVFSAVDLAEYGSLLEFINGGGSEVTAATKAESTTTNLPESFSNFPILTESSTNLPSTDTNLTENPSSSTDVDLTGPYSYQHPSYSSSSAGNVDGIDYIINPESIIQVVDETSGNLPFNYRNRLNKIKKGCSGWKC